MQSQKLNVVLGALFGVLTILSVIKWTTSSTDFVDYAEVPRLVPGFTPQNVHIVQLTKGKAGDPQQGQQAQQPEVEIVFRKDGENWFLNSREFAQVPMKALGSQIEDRILKKIEKLEVNVSTLIDEEAKAEELKKYGLDEDYWEVTCMDASQKVLATIQIGRQAGREGDDWQSKVKGSYVKRADQDSVLLSDEPIEMFEKVEDWLDKSVMSVDESQVARIELRNEKGELVLERVDDGKDEGAEKPASGDVAPGTWKVVRGPDNVGKLRDYAVSTLLSRACNVNAKTFVSTVSQQAAMDAGLIQPSMMVTLTLRDENKTQKNIRVGKRLEGEQAYYAIASERREMILSPGRVGRLGVREGPEGLLRRAAGGSEEGGAQEGRRQARRAEEGRRQAGRAQEGRRQAGRAQEGRRQAGRAQERREAGLSPALVAGGPASRPGS
jgi:hypothetical protein